MSNVIFDEQKRVDRGRHVAARILAALGALLFCCVSQVATAVPFPAGIAGTVSFNVFPPDPIDVRTFGTHALSGLQGELQLDAGLTPSPFISASGSIADNFFGRSVATLHYDFEIIGPSGIIPIVVTANGEVRGDVHSTDPFAVFALKSTWSLDSLGGIRVFGEGIETPAMIGSFSDSFNHTTGLNLFANQAYRVNLLADVGVRGGSASAYIDPVFAFATGFGEGYSFVFSEGVGNAGDSPDPDSTPIPAPSTLALLFAGLLPLRKFAKRI